MINTHRRYEPKPHVTTETEYKWR